MKMQTLSKILIVLMIAFIVLAIAQPIVYGIDLSGISAIEPSGDEVSGVKTMASRVLGIIQVATAIVAVILVAVFGFKFVLGSAQEKADYQKSFIPLIVGVVVVFAAVSIAQIIMNVAT